MQKLKKIFSVFLIFFLFNCFNSYAETVNKVVVNGNDRISLETVLIFADVELGKNYEADDVNLMIKKLYDTTFFSDISVELENGVLSFTVKENPIINTIVFDGEKAKKYIEAINEFLTLREKTSFREGHVKSDINVLKEFYRQLGFYFVKIDLKVEQLDKNRVNLIYSIDKGKKAKIEKIFFLGDKKIRESRLRSVITSQEAKFWKFVSRNVYLNKERIELDKRLLKSYYKNKGYYEVDISTTNVEYAAGEGFVLSYTINAGKRYKFQKIYANVSKELDKEAFASLEKYFSAAVGKWYSHRELTNILEKIDKLSEQKELQFINHRVDETLIGQGVEVKIDIFEGEKFTIERIDVVGNNVTNDSVIRSALAIDEGDPYSELLINKSINQLKARGIFGNVDKKITEGSAPNLKVMEISVEEKATGEVAAGAGVGTDGTSFMASVTENNWLGKGIKLNSSFNISEEKVSGNIYVNNPNYNYSGNAVFAAIDISSTDAKESSGYESSNTGFSLGTQFEQYENVYFAPSLTANLEDIEVEASASDSVKKMDGTFTNLDFDYSVIVDQRNQAFQPTEGYRSQFSQSLPIILDSSHIKNGFNISAYRDFSDDIIGVFKLYGQSVHGLDDEDVRITSRLYLPQKRLRGFNTRKVGPKDGEDWVGGNYTTAAGFEALLPNLLPESTRTDVSLFVDTGNVWHIDYSDSVEDTNKIRSSIGLSANMFTTIGPLSFTIAQDMTKATNDQTQTFNFRLGTSF